MTLYRTVMTYARRAGQAADELQYVVQPEGLVAPLNGSGGAQAWEYRYFKTDHTGSTRVVLAASGAGPTANLTAVQTTDYYPFGMAHGSLNNLNLNRYLYGGKEYQDGVLNGSALGLYDFHARYYDPVLGRWFNVDPALQLVNPYLYAGNSPMIYRDANGEWFFKVLLSAFGPIGTIVGSVIDAAAWGATISAAGYTANVALSPGGFNNWNWNQFGKSVGWGAVSGAATFGVGQAFGSPGSFGLELARGATHGLVQGGISAAQGGSFWQGAASGALSSWAGSGFRTTKFGQSRAGMYAFSSLAGGVGAAATGGNFWKGAAIGAMNAGLNHLQSTIQFYQDRNQAFREMQAYQRRTGNEVAGAGATRDDGQESGIVVQWDERNTSEVSHFEDFPDEGEGHVNIKRDGLFRRYNLSGDHYHTHPTYESMQTVSTKDFNMQKQWSKPLNILYNNRVWQLQYRDVDNINTYWYERTKAKY